MPLGRIQQCMYLSLLMSGMSDLMQYREPGCLLEDEGAGCGASRPPQACAPISPQAHPFFELGQAIHYITPNVTELRAFPLLQHSQVSL
jgi:hypothetical protein